MNKFEIIVLLNFIAMLVKAESDFFTAKDNFLYCESLSKERAIDLNRVCDPVASYKSATNVWFKKVEN